MSTSGVPTKVGGLHIERTGEDLVVYNPVDQSTRTVTKLTAAVFEACNGSRSPDAVADTVAGWVREPVDPVVIDLTIIDLVDDGLVTFDESVIDLRD